MNSCAYTFRPATIGDLADIHTLESTCFPDPWSRTLVASSLNDDTTHTMVALRNNMMHGYCIIRIVAPNEAELLKIAVHPAAQGTSLAHTLWSQSLRPLPCEFPLKVFLEVRAQNTRAIRFYEKLDFVRVGKRRQYYAQPPDDAVIMLTTALSPAHIFPT